MAGTAHMNRIWQALSKAGASVWRNNTFKAWAGKSFQLDAGQKYIATTRCRVVLDPRLVEGGLVKGSSDLIGFVPVKITEDMVGKTVAVFAGWEVKEGTGRPDEDQKNFVGHVAAAGGIGIVVRSEAEALASIGTVKGV